MNRKPCGAVLHSGLVQRPPHSPIQATRNDLDKNGFDPAKQRAPNTDKGSQDAKMLPVTVKVERKQRATNVRCDGWALDRNVGRILETVQRTGKRDNTIVVLHSDNGGIPKHGGSNRPLRGNKFTTWDGGVRVVAMIRWPARLPGGTKYSAVSGYIDLLPTLIAAADGPQPDGVDGINLLPFLTGKQKPQRRTILLDENTVVTDHWKLKDGQFFDLQRDPNEGMPVANPPQQISRMLQSAIAKFPALNGPKTETRLPTPTQWPPSEWKLPQEEN